MRGEEQVSPHPRPRPCTRSMRLPLLRCCCCSAAPTPPTLSQPPLTDLHLFDEPFTAGWAFS